jgi:hypothetical protein
MLGAYEGLMKAAEHGMNPGGMQATPVHHVGKGTLDQPEPGSIKDEAMGFLGEVEANMKKFRPGSHAHNQLSGMRGQILMDIADMDVEHQKIMPEALQGLESRRQNLKAKTKPYQEGLTPEFKPTR